MVVVHHFNKKGQYRGATAFKASVDIHCEFRQAPKGPRTQRELAALGRLGARRVLVDFDKQTHQYYRAGEKPTHSTRVPDSSPEQSEQPVRSRGQDTAAKLWHILPDGPPGLTVRELVQLYQRERQESMSDSQVQRWLDQWWGCDMTERAGTPRSKVVPLRHWRLAETCSG